MKTAKKATAYVAMFEKEVDADSWMRMKNRTNRIRREVFCLVDGPENNFAVVDLNTAIELGGPYRWAL